jgi:hypothetical protein
LILKQARAVKSRIGHERTQGDKFAAIPDRLLPLPAVRDNAAMPTEPSKAEPPKRSRRWLQFSLRTLMIGALVVALLLVIFLPALQRAKESGPRQSADPLSDRK